MVSGGSGGNAILPCLRYFASVSHVLPISDNGGSTSEILRVLGGPGIGDLRSRLLRLIEHDQGEVGAMKELLNHRLDNDGIRAKTEFGEIVDGTHRLWNNITSEKRELLRSFLVYVSAEITKRIRPLSPFHYEQASLGNLFLTGARLFFGSLESAIYLLASITHIPESNQVIPVLNTNFPHHIAARLQEGTVIVGQSQISHATDIGLAEEQTEEDANLPGSLSTLRRKRIVYEKENAQHLPSPIKEIFYINPYGEQIKPLVNPKVIHNIASSQGIVYSCGSLFTSIIPCLVLEGAARAIVASNACKILILNGSLDRETGPSFTALDFIYAITNACQQSMKEPVVPSSVLTDIIYLIASDIQIDTLRIESLGINVSGVARPAGSTAVYDTEELGNVLVALIGKESRG